MSASDAAQSGVADTVIHDPYNPFADPPSSGSFASGLHSPTKRGLHRRRTSEHEVASTSWTISQSRSRTSLETSRHPLGSDLQSTSSSSHHLDITRPRLTKLTLSAEGASDLPPLDHREVVTRDEEDRLVLVHEVVPKDTLAGVALTYGISMSNLRRANQLWTSDSIHLRKVLHIPLTKAAKLKHLEDIHSHRIDIQAAADPFSNEPSSMNIHRVPASRLSYFPSTSRVNSVNSDDDASKFGTFPYHFEPPENGGYRNTVKIPNPSTSIHQQSVFPNITSLFSAFPQSLPSPREGIISRLSLDSNGTSGTPSSDGQEHEMDELDTSFRPTHAPKPLKGSVSAERARRPAQTARNTSSGPHNQQYTAEEEFSISSTPVVRTSQLEPSLDMHLPVIVRKKSKS